MTSKEYLKQAYRLDQRIKSDIEELGRLRETVAGAGSPGFEEHRNPNRPTEAPYVQGVERICEMEEKINAEIDRFVDLKEQIRMMIERMDDPDEQMVLRYRYIHNYIWEDIASEMNYSLRWIYKIHSKALDSFEAVLKETGCELS